MTNDAGRSAAGMSVYRRVQRANLRSRRHGNWRQIYIDCAGMCIARESEDSLPCGETEHLEFHHPEHDKQTQERYLLCAPHHAWADGIHDPRLIKKQSHRSSLTSDVNDEIARCGSVEDWELMYMLDDSRFGRLLRNGPILPLLDVTDCGVPG